MLDKVVFMEKDRIANTGSQNNRGESMRLHKLIIIIFILFAFSLSSHGGESRMSDTLISEEQAIKIAREYLQNKKYNYEIDWDHPDAKLERFSLKTDGSLSPHGFGKKVMVWRIRFRSLQKIDLDKGIRHVLADIDARTGKVFANYSLNKL